MALLDYSIFGICMLAVPAIGFIHFLHNKSSEDHYVGSRSIKARHVGLSIAATDAGGGFPIGPGGAGFLMGLSVMLAGRSAALLLMTGMVTLPEAMDRLGPDAGLYGIVASLLFCIAFSLSSRAPGNAEQQTKT